MYVLAEKKMCDIIFYKDEFPFETRDITDAETYENDDWCDHPSNFHYMKYDDARQYVNSIMGCDG